MKEEIAANINEPAQLEKLYRANKSAFKKAFVSAYPDLPESAMLSFWYERLHYKADDLKARTTRDVLFVIFLSLIAGLIAKIPGFFSFNEDFFYTRNIAFIVFPVISIYFIRSNKISAGKVLFIGLVTLIALTFINFFPDDKKSDTLLLSCLHLPILLWTLLGIAFVGNDVKDKSRRLDFLQYNGDLVIITGLLCIAGVILSVITLGLFNLIGFHIEDFFFKNVILFGLPAAPIIGTYLIQTNPQLVGKISPVIAKIFSPLVLLMLLIYLAAIFYSKKDPYNDREFLLIFNALLIGVMAIILFSVIDTSGTEKSEAAQWTLMLLSLVTIIVNCIALSAILFRISEWGITANRLAVLGSNILILVNLLMVAVQLLRVLSNKVTLSQVGKTIASYLPVYVCWTIIVTFIFPVIFDFQ